MTVFGCTYDTLQSINNKMNEKNSCHWLATRKFDKVMQMVPPKAVVQSFFRDSMFYIAERADRIYEYNESVVDIINAEII